MLELIVATGQDLIRIQPEDARWNGSKLLRGRGIQCLATDLRSSHVLYSGCRGEGIWKSTNDGREWERVDFPEADVFALAVSPVDGAVYAGTEPSKLFVSRDQARSWSELTALQQIPSRPTWSFPPRPWTSHVRAIAPSPFNAQLLLVGIELGGVMRSEDGGVTWSDHPPGAQKDVHALAWHPRVPGRAYEAGGGGAAWSRDAGLTWQAADGGRDRHYSWGLALEPDDADYWYISANPGPGMAHDGRRNAEAYVYRWCGGGPWHPLGDGLPQPLDSFPYALAADSQNLFVGLGDGRVYWSKNRGDGWEQLIIHGEAPRRILAMAVRNERMTPGAQAPGDTRFRPDLRQ
jgi:hypothetical protein